MDDHAIIRDGIKALIGMDGKMDVIGEAADGKEAVEKAAKLRPDLIIMDIGLPVMDGLEATRRILKRNPAVRILILTQHDNKEYVLSSIKAGAKGYLPKKAVGSDLIKAIDTLHRGESYLYPSAASALISTYRTNLQEADPYDSLTPREREVLKLIAEGNTGKQIAADLCLSVKTVMGHRAKIMSKLEVHNKTDLIKFAMRKGLINI